MAGRSKSEAQPPEVTHVDAGRLEGLMGYQIRRASNAVQADLAATLREYDLRMITYATLLLIADNPGVRQSQLADALNIERPNLVVIIDELERRDLINRDRVPTDRRAYALSATEAGRQLADEAFAADMAREAALFEGLDEDELAQMRALLRKIRAGSQKV